MMTEPLNDLEKEEEAVAASALTSSSNTKRLSKRDSSSLHDSSEAMTPMTTDTGSMNSDDGEEETSSSSGTGAWFGIVGTSDIKTLARSIKDNVPPAIDGLASFIHRSALTVAAEIAQLEKDAELETERWREENYGRQQQSSVSSHRSDDETLHLPWEVPHHTQTLRSSLPCETIYEEDEELKQRIFDLSTHEETFLLGSGKDNDDDDDDEDEDVDGSFSLDEPRINLIRRLLELDDNLAAMHAKLSGRSDVKETAFWRNYFHRCERTRQEHLQQKVAAVDNKANVDDDDDVASLDSAAAGSNSLGSLVPAGENDGGKPDDASYEYIRSSIASPPSSANTVHTDLSVGDMVLVRAEMNELDKDTDV